MNLHYFKKNNNLELLPFGASHIDLGELVWKEPFRRPNWLENGLPKDIFKCFFHFELLDSYSLEKGLDKLKKSPLQPSPFSECIITTNRRYSKHFPHPVAININKKIIGDLQHTYFFSCLEQKKISSNCREKIEKQLKLIQQETNRLYHTYSPVYIVTEVHFGALNFSPRNSVSNCLQEYLNQSIFKGEVVCADTISKEKVYRFAHQNIPFAIKLENLKTFKA